MDTNVLYYGDNLVWLRKHDFFPDNSVDLIYLDPPFNSKTTYNVLFKEPSGKPSQAQITAFEDTWHWNEDTQKAFQEIMESGLASPQVKEFISVLPKLIGDRTDMRAYLVMMCIRLIELHRVLKPMGSIYLHCDPTASHYLKILLDTIFGHSTFRNEIIWRRTGTHGKTLRYSPVHDTILFYTKSDQYKWNSSKKPYMKRHVEEYFVHDEKGWRTNYYGNVLTGSGLRKGESGKVWQGFDPSAKGRHWAIPNTLLEDINEDLTDYSQHQKLDKLLNMGRIKIIPGQAWPIYEHYLEPNEGQSVSDIWAFQPYTDNTIFGTNKGIDEDVRWLSPQDQERLGYPTQKPEGLLERIINASSSEGDIVLDPFCGCGTAIIVAQRLKRKWVGIDITHLAIGTMKWRLEREFPKLEYTIRGEPADLSGAEQLAKDNKYEFQWWAVSKIKGQPYGNKKKGADTGIDGYKYFMVEQDKINKAIISVKGGGTSVKDIRDLIGVLEREKSPIGIFITLHEPTKPMLEEAIKQGYYQTPLGTKHFKVQILTMAKLQKGIAS